MNGKTKLVTALTALTIGVTALIGSSALAQPGGHRGPGGEPPAFSELDMNGDGVITADDLDALKAQRWAELDTNGDGVASADELAARAVERAAERAADMAARIIADKDSDGDGALSQAEIEARGDDAGGQRGDRGDRGDNGRRGPGGPGGPGGDLIERADTDGDGAVSEAEFSAWQDQMAQHRKDHGQRGGDGN